MIIILLPKFRVEQNLKVDDIKKQVIPIIISYEAYQINYKFEENKRNEQDIKNVK